MEQSLSAGKPTQDQAEGTSPKKRKTEDINQNDKENDPNRSEEQHFLRLYTLILNGVIKNYGVTEEDITESIERISDSFIYTSGSRFQFSAIDFRRWENVCAYLYRYGSHGAGFARNRISKALKNCGDLGVLQGPSNDLGVVCLGAGPGNDAVGLCSALAEWRRPGGNLKIFLVDKFQEWSTCAKLAWQLIGKQNFGNASELMERSNFKSSYAFVDLPGKEYNTEYFQFLQEADVIVISKLLSILDFNKCEEIIESLKIRMKQEAFIFLMDQYLDFLWDGFEVIYTWGTEECDIYQSSAQAEPRFYAFDNLQSKFPIRILRRQKFEEYN